MKRSLRIRRAIFLVGTGVLLFAALELVARSFLPPPTTDPYRLLPLTGADGYAALSQQRDAGAFLDEAHLLLEPDPRLLWRLRPSLDLSATGLALGTQRAWRVRTSPDGYRDRPLSDLPEGERRVLAAGDSSTFGWGVEDEQAWPSVLEEDLGEGWQVINVGVPGYSSLQGLRVVERLAPTLAPDVLVVAFGANDGHMGLQGDQQALDAREGPLGQARHAAAGLRLVQLGRRALFPAWANGLVVGWRLGLAQPRVAPALFEEALEDLAGHAPRTVLVDVCARREYGLVMTELARVRRDVEILRYDKIHGETLDGCHPTPTGHRALAARLATLLEPE